MALSYKMFPEKRSLRLKLNCLNSSYQLGPKVPLGQRCSKVRSLLTCVQPSYVTQSLNQMLSVRNRIKQDTMSIHNITNGEPNKIVKLIDKNIQAPKFLSKKYGAGALQRPFFSKRGGISGQAIYAYSIRPYCKCSRLPYSKGVEKLKTIRNIGASKPDYIFKRLYNLILLEDLYLIAYQRLKAKKRIIASRPEGESPDDLASNSIGGIIEEIQYQTFEFTPARRITIPKRDRNSRLLSVPSFKDKIVQEVIRIILEAVFEPTFSPHSHGFRKGKNCHTALKDVRVIFAGSKWLMTRDIEKCFDSLNHRKLISILQERISDRRFTNLVWKLLRAGYANDFKIITTSLRGAPQGGAVSPILSNIYIHKLDIFIIELAKEFNKGKHRATNLKYSNSRAAYNYWKNKDTKLSNKYLFLNNSLSPKDPLDKNYRRLNYVRYADDFIIGVTGSVKEAQKIKEEVNNFLVSSLSLSVSSKKSKLVRASKEKAKFLGVLVRIPVYKEPSFSTYKRTCKGKTQFVKAKSPQSIVKLKANIKVIVYKLNTVGFCDKLGEPTPRFKLYAMSHNEIILIYNRVLRGLKNYFKFTDNFSTLASQIQRILIGSCAKLLAAKLKLKTTRAVYKKFGKDLNKEGPKFAWSKSYSKNRIRFRTSNIASDCIYTLYIKKYISSDLYAPCIICGSCNDIEIHHIKHIKNIDKRLKALVDDYVTVNRKQVPLCKRCHRKAHKGFYDGPKLAPLLHEK